MAKKIIHIIKTTFSLTNLWTSVVPMQLLGFVAIFLISTNQATTAWPWYLAVGYFLIMVVGVSIGYHRLFSHRAFKAHPWIETFILWCGTLSGQGSVMFWTILHRGYHHKHADTDQDPHSPRHGFWRSYIGWMWQLKEGDLNPKYGLDLIKNPRTNFFHRHYTKIFLVSHAVIFAINWDLWLYGAVLPAFVTFHAWCLLNTMGHSSRWSYRNYDTQDRSRNVWWLWPVLFGECWHNNHHADMKNPRHGSRWWEIDPAYRICCMISSQKLEP